MMNITLLKRFSAAALFLASLTGQAFAIEDCGPNAIDPDNDGWGWENGMSCRITAIEPPVINYCQLADSDPDGDGWGWEGGTSCRVDSGNTDPGTSFDTAGPIAINSAISGTLNGTARHFYSFEVTETTSVDLSTNFSLDGSIDILIIDEQNTYLEPRFGQQDACLAPGTYYLLLDRLYVDTVDNIDYSATINTTDVQCTTPITTLDANESDQFLVADDGSIYSVGWNNDYTIYSISKIDNTGVTLWTTVTDFIQHIKTTPDGSLVVSTYETLSLLDFQGQLVWSVDNQNNYSSNIAIGSQSVILENNGALLSYNLTDGAQRWRYDLPDDAFIDNITVNSEGLIVASLGHQILMFEE